MVPGWWGRQRLRDRVRFVFASTGVVLVVVVGVALFNMGRLVTAVHTQVDRLDPAAVTGRDLSRALLDQETGVRGFVLTGNEDFLQPYIKGRQDEQTAVDRLRSEIKDRPDLEGDMLAVEQAATTWQTRSAEVFIADVRAGRGEQARTALASDLAQQQFDAVRSAVAALDADLSTKRAAAEHRLRTATRQLIVLLTATAVGLAVAGAAALWAFNRWIIVPLARLVREVRAVADGDITHEVAGTGPPDLVSLGRDVEAMRERIVTELDRAVRAREALEQRGELVLRLREGLAPSEAHAPGLPHAARLIPAEGMLAGDFYDVFELDGGGVGLLVVDVAGHGADAGLFAYRLKALLSSAVRSSLDPGAALDWTAQQLGDTAERFATAILVMLDVETGRGRYASAGHHPPLVLRHHGATQLPPTGPLLGPLDGVWRTEEFVLGDGDLLVTFTDGLVEARNHDGMEFGVEQLVAVLSAHRADGTEAMVEACVGAVRAHVGGRRLADDCTIVLLGWPDRRRQELEIVGGGERRRDPVRSVLLHHPLLEVHLPGEASSAALARALVRQTLLGTGWEPKLAAILTAVEEVVRAAITDTGDVVTMRLDRQGDRMRVTVRNPGAPPPLPGSETAAFGTGVEDVADAWGVTESGVGLDVWFEVPAARVS